ncbi:unnamed protein product [Orchesella dallaii]|uniref:Uncharacterized protein n=1 Tax=Orchesella dallaii TaxID=48710 RepID=A0ABP1Q8A0_9HEXA
MERESEEVLSESDEDSDMEWEPTSQEETMSCKSSSDGSMGSNIDVDVDLDSTTAATDTSNEPTPLVLEEFNGVLTLETPGLQFLCAKAFGNAKSYVDVLFIVPDFGLIRELSDLIVEAKPPYVYIMVAYSRELTRLVLRDNDLMRNHSVFFRRIPMPYDRTYHDRSFWMSELILIPLLLSSVEFSFKGTKIRTLCRRGIKSLPAHLMDMAWMDARQTIMFDVAEILENNANYYCTRCTDACPFKQRNWHFQLDTFQKLEPVPEPGESALRQLDLFRGGEVPTHEAMKSLRTLYLNSTIPTLKEVFKVLDENCTAFKDEWYCSYMILLLDGPEMRCDQNATLESLLADPDVEKAVYAGFTRNQYFRKSHFTSHSAINEVLTASSRLFFIRKKIFNTFRDARKDEGIMIELLKMNLRFHWDKDKSTPFTLLNRKSEVGSMLTMTAEQINSMLTFINSGLPIFRSSTAIQIVTEETLSASGVPAPTDAQTRSATPGEFNSYTIEEEIEWSRAVTPQRSYDDVKQMYANLRRKVRL